MNGLKKLQLKFPFLALFALMFATAAQAAPEAPEGADKPAPLPTAEEVLPAPGEPGQVAPGFTLTDTEGKKHSLSDYLKEKKVVVLEWFNPDCPVVKSYHEPDSRPAIKDAVAFARENGAVWLAVNSGAPGAQGNGLEKNQQARGAYGIDYPVLIDESGEVGHSYGASATPHIFVISADGVVVYNGAPDDSGWKGGAATRNYIIDALSAELAGQPVATPKTTAVGCSVKYAK
jgi:peroxiredoxin